MITEGSVWLTPALSCGIMKKRRLILMGEKAPSMDLWLREAKDCPDAPQMGMILTHNGIVRQTPKSLVRSGIDDNELVAAIDFSYDERLVQAAAEETRRMAGIYFVKVWLNSGCLQVGEDLMLVMIGGDIRPRVIEAMQFLLGKLKNECVIEREITE